MTRPIFATFLFLFLSSISVFSQGVITGKLVDGKTGETLMGVAVMVEGTTNGAVSDMDGNYKITGITPGKINLIFQYVGYSKTIIQNVEVKGDEPTILNQGLKNEEVQMKEVEVVAEYKRESVNALAMQMRNQSAIGSAISTEDIKRAPDKSTSEVLRRVSGASIQDGKFAIIRGLNDRYNVAMINGAPLPSTEPDKRAFSFDLIPSGMLDNVTILKTGRADLPGDFAGGIIQINTKDIPDKNYYTLNTSMGFNTTTSFQPSEKYAGGKTDFLGIDDGTRALPKDFPSTEIYSKLNATNAPGDSVTRYSKEFKNNWGTKGVAITQPNYSLQFTTGQRFKVKETEIGNVLCISYNNQRKTNTVLRQDFNDTIARFEYHDKDYVNNVLWGAMWNFAVKIKQHTKIRFQNAFNINSENLLTKRTGVKFEDDFNTRNSLLSFTSNRLISSQLTGEHSIGKRDVRLTWEGAYSRVDRFIPDQRRSFYQSASHYDTTEGQDQVYFAQLSFSANPQSFGRFQSELHENDFSGNVDLSVPFQLLKQKSVVKMGGFTQYRKREFTARNLGYVLGPKNYSYQLQLLPEDSLFALQNIGPKGFVIQESTNPNDQYTANALTGAAYAMGDFRLHEKLKINIGVRFEYFHQKLLSHLHGGQELAVDTSYFDVLPSMNIIYSITKSQNLRASVSQTVSRPEFRELAPFAFYDFNNELSISGNDILSRCKIVNADLRYEYFFGNGQWISFTGFFKHFKDPIENSFIGGNKELTWTNGRVAYNFGFEFEVRKNFDFLAKATGWKPFENFAFIVNAAYINSRVKLNDSTSRSLQGQSPYVINAGLQYNDPKIGLNVNLMYNQVGRRILFVGTTGFQSYRDIYERSRPLLDLQISQRVCKNGELKLTVTDMIHKNIELYQDVDKNGKFDASIDNLYRQTVVGTTVSIGFGLKF